ncbi:hypothetical protein PF003_g38488 [Phytophthora fragariae]|nr:hypothetical protein PF003_g38488 [Phytophthora fragariae]
MFVAAGVGRVLSGVRELLRRLGILYDKRRSQEARSRRGPSAVVGGVWWPSERSGGVLRVRLAGEEHG